MKQDSFRKLVPNWAHLIRLYSPKTYVNEIWLHRWRANLLYGSFVAGHIFHCNFFSRCTTCVQRGFLQGRSPLERLSSAFLCCRDERCNLLSRLLSRRFQLLAADLEREILVDTELCFNKAQLLRLKRGKHQVVLRECRSLKKFLILDSFST